MVTGQREDLFSGNALFTRGIADDHFLWSNFLHLGFKQCLDLPRFDPILDIRFHPIFDRLTQVRIVLR